MTDSLRFRESHSCRLSESSSQHKKNKYRCYNCSVTPSPNCLYCQGTNQVSEDDPMVGLLMQVMCLKLGKQLPTIKKMPALEFCNPTRNELRITDIVSDLNSSMNSSVSEYHLS